jgi:hypothetical protein
MKSLILCIFLTVAGLDGLEAKADNYIVQPQHQIYVIQQPVRPAQPVIMVSETPFYFVYVPVPQPVYVQQWYYWQYPYRKVCYRLYGY